MDIDLGTVVVFLIVLSYSVYKMFDINRKGIIEGKKIMLKELRDEEKITVEVFNEKFKELLK